MQSKEEKHFIHNHLTFLVKYHRDDKTDLARIVAFEVKPFRLIFDSMPKNSMLEIRPSVSECLWIS
jgi:hypothetical protein